LNVEGFSLSQIHCENEKQAQYQALCYIKLFQSIQISSYFEIGDSLVVPDLWGTIRVYDAHIQSLKAFKSDYENLLSQKKDLEEAQSKYNQYY